MAYFDMNELVENKIKNIIHNIRGRQVMLDSDLAKLYDVETKYLKRQVKRNIERFPQDFMFQLNNIEYDLLRCQIVTSKKGGIRYMPFVFTEQGVAMLSGVLGNKKAIEVNIQIMRTFISMRKFLSKNGDIFQRLNEHDKKFLEYNDKFEKLFNAIDIEKPKQGIFFDGQIFDAHKFVSDLINSTKKKIILIDNYVDHNTLLLFSELKDIKVIIYTMKITDRLRLDWDKFNAQYFDIKINEFDKSHDRFLIIDKEMYHFGASLKDLGKKWFAFSKLNLDCLELLNRL